MLFKADGFLSHIIDQELRCQSPQQLAALLRQHLSSDGPSPRGPLRILDIAAGNGRLGIETRSQLGQQPGISCLVGTGLMESAKPAMRSDQKPNPYDNYVVADLTDSSQPDIHRWKKTGFDVMTICAGLGPGDGDLPLEVLAGGWIAYVYR